MQQRHEELTADDRRELASLRHVPARAWIDGANNVRRFAIDVAVDDVGKPVYESTVEDLSHFGEHITVRPPAPGDTVSAAEYRRYQAAHPGS